MAQALREPVNIVSKYLRSSPARSRPPGSPNRHHGTLASPHFTKFHDNRPVREEQEESDSDIEVFGPFSCSEKAETKPKTWTTIVAGAVAKGATDPEHSPRNKPPHQFLLDDTLISTHRVNKPRSLTSTSSRTSSSILTRQTRKPAPMLAEMAAAPATFVAPVSALSEPPANLPAYSYKDYTDPKPYVAYTRDAEEADDLIAALKPGPVAYDMEWCFSFFARKLKVRKTAVIQIADSAGLVVIVHLSEMSRFPNALRVLLENPAIPKLGANIMADGKKLFRDYGVLAKNLLELAALAVAWDPGHTITRKVTSLAKLTETYCGKALGKGAERTSNWEVPELDELQKDYAANDVHCTMEIYKRLSLLAAPRALDIPPGADVPWYLPKDIENVEAGGEPMRLQWRRAHRLWHETGMALEKMCAEMRIRKEGVPDEGPLKSSTADPKLPFDIEKLRRLVSVDPPSWTRHRRWLIQRALEMQAQLAASEGAGSLPVSAGAGRDMADINSLIS
ncbi:hypothetical protein C0992_002227 [Termitomyces sp. T32_za158]|nr:hypothetical protein C0992_002227 [Termitomyces sp. T32_za158]